MVDSVTLFIFQMGVTHDVEIGNQHAPSHQAMSSQNTKFSPPSLSIDGTPSKAHNLGLCGEGERRGWVQVLGRENQKRKKRRKKLPRQTRPDLTLLGHTEVPFWGRITSNLHGLSPKWELQPYALTYGSLT